MSVRTDADNKLEETVKHVELAIKALSAVVVDEVRGAEEYSRDARASFRTQLNALLGVRDALKP